MNLLLCNVQLDRANDNVILFNNKEELAQYFENLEDKVVVDYVNFNAQDLINTSIFVKVDNNLDLFRILNYNYCVVKQGNNLPNLYYFIERSTQDNGAHVKLDLTIDVFNTYAYSFLGEDSKTQGYINRAHLDRFITYNNTNYFNYEANSPLFEREKTKDVPKRVVKRVPLTPLLDVGGDTLIDSFIMKNVLGWVYYFLDYKEYDVYNFLGTKKETLGEFNIKSSLYDFRHTGFSVICCPIMKEGSLFRIKYTNDGTTTTKTWSLTGLNTFLEDNNNYANVIAVKFSNLPPLPIMEYKGKCSFSADFKVATLSLQLDGLFKFDRRTYFDGEFLTPSSNVGQAGQMCIFELFNQYTNNKQEFYYNKYSDPKLEIKWDYSKDEITNETEPKLYNEDFALYNLTIGGKQHELSISKTSPTPRFLYSEILSPDITKGNLTIKTSSIPFENKVLTDAVESNFFGFNFTLDLSTWFPQNQLDTYLANNKNYLQIYDANRAADAVKTITGVGTNILSNPTPTSFLSGFQTFLNKGVDTMVQDKIREYTFDNMRNAPSQTQNINSGPMLIQNVSGSLGIFLEVLEMLPHEKSQVLDDFKMFGYNYSKIGYLKDFVKTRKYYNYVQGLLFEVDANIAEQTRDKIKEIFAKGVRIWHADAWDDISQFKIDFDLNNIERSIK